MSTRYSELGDADVLGQLRLSLRSLTPHELERRRPELLALLETIGNRPSRCIDCDRSIGPQANAPHARLSRREHEVMSMLLAGKRLKEIAAILDISVKTVTTHRSRLLRKLGVEDNLGLYRYGVRNGLIGV